MSNTDHPLDATQRALWMAHTLALPAPVREALEALCPRLPWHDLAPHIRALCDARKAPDAQKTLAGILASGEDNSGFAQLAAHLAAAGLTRQRYREAGVDDIIFWETMRCFPRFLSETHASTGRWAFDRAFWTWRQTSCCLFRLGTLEFEYRTADETQIPGVQAGSAVLSVHIPSDARFTEEALAASYAPLFFAGGLGFLHTGHAGSGGMQHMAARARAAAAFARRFGHPPFCLQLHLVRCR